MAHVNTLTMSNVVSLYAEAFITTNDGDVRTVLYATNGIYRDECDFSLYFGTWTCLTPEQTFYLTVFANDNNGRTFQRSLTGFCSASSNIFAFLSLPHQILPALFRFQRPYRPYRPMAALTAVSWKTALVCAHRSGRDRSVLKFSVSTAVLVLLRSAAVVPASPVLIAKQVRQYNVLLS